MDGHAKLVMWPVRTVTHQ